MSSRVIPRAISGAFGSSSRSRRLRTIPGSPSRDPTALPILTTPGASYRSVYRADKVGTPENTLFQDVAGTIPVTAVGQTIACWKSSVGSGMMTQATATKRPTLQQRPDGKYVVRFDGVDDQMDAANGLISPGTVSCSIGSYHAWVTTPNVFESVWSVGPAYADEEYVLMNTGGGANRVRIHTGSAGTIIDPVGFLNPSSVIFRTQPGSSNLIVGLGSELTGPGNSTAISAGTQSFGFSPAGNYGDCDVAAFFSVEMWINNTDRTRIKIWMEGLMNL